MKPGRVVTMRVNSKDCMGVVDVLDKVGAYTPGMSFAQAVSIALASLLETVRTAGALPERTGFEYLEMMQRFPTDRRRGKAMAIAEAIELHRAEGNIPAIAVPDDAMKARRRIRFNEMRFRKEADSINWSEADQQEFQALVDEFL